MKIALVQIGSPEDEPVAARFDRVAGLVRSAASADLIVLPELWATGYFAFDDYARDAEPADGPSLARLGELARETGAYLHGGSFVERLPDGALRNTAVLFDPSGKLVHSYSKVHVFGYQSKEAQLLKPGDHVSAVATPFGAVAGTTCYDLRFPELWRCLVDAGAEIVIVPAAWPAARLAHWRLFTTARAVEDQVLVVACNATGTQGGVELGGHSRVVDPWGTVLAEAGTEEGITWCDVDPGVVPATREQFPVLDDRLPSYRELTIRGAHA
ncbi:carbon-nitrogen family hydrolase [Amycolatopsis sp. NPDC023774]|uniref:carbon-nitrogen family hydrolase n=1 Tax=Amycolatopsis sp. NPDC023774 TaxID=3155015 RepID=UPI0033F5B796